MYQVGSYGNLPNDVRHQFLTEVDSVGIPNDDFGVATALQGQRSMQLSASIRF